MMQMPNASYVASYTRWKQLGRYVNAGEKAIKIVAPIFPRRKRSDNPNDVDKDIRDTQRCFFKVVNVFDISQTSGKQLPLDITHELSASVTDYNILLKAVESVSAFPVFFANLDDAYGFFDKEKILVKSGLSESHTIKTLLHEIAHSELHTESNLKKDRHRMEIEAEGVAYVVCSHFNIDTSDYTFNYVAFWSASRTVKELKDSLSLICKTSASLIKEIEAYLNKYKGCA